jgi:hypothetical protein
MWGYVNAEGTLVIPRRFDFAYNFKNGRAEVELGGKLVTIDRTGRVVE